MFKKEFEIRWSDVDPNKHLANYAYTNFMSHTRLAFLVEYGFTRKEIDKHNIGSVVFYEHIHYFKEAFMGEPITVSLEVSGLSENGTFFKFEHNFYNSKGENIAFCEMMGAWIDFKKRKTTALPEPLLSLAKTFPKAEDYKILTKADTRTYNRRPKNLVL